jgi:hypothetical protein
MIEEMKTAYRFLIVLSLGGLLLLFSVLVPVISSNADFSIYNTSWNGCSNIGKEAYSTGSFLPSIDVSSSSEEMIVHSSFVELREDLDPDDSSIMIIGPELEFTGDEIRFLHDYMFYGGILFLADDFGSGDQLLGSLETDTRISQKTMIDLSFMKQPVFSLTSDIRPHNITDGVNTILMNYPSTISGDNSSITLINSSEASWLDEKRDDERSIDEEMGPFSILTMEDYGEGKLIVLSDPSLLINNMRDEFDNSRLISNIISYISNGRSSLVIDESHRDLTNPVQVSNIFVGNLNLGSKISIITGFILFFILISTPYPKRIWKALERLLNKLLSEEEKGKTTLEENLKVVFQKHPEWDKDLMNRLIDDIGVDQ